MNFYDEMKGFMRTFYNEQIPEILKNIFLNYVKAQEGNTTGVVVIKVSL